MESSYFALLRRIEERLDVVDRALSVDMFRSQMRYAEICARSDVSLNKFVRELHAEWTAVLSSVAGTDCPLVAKLSGVLHTGAFDVKTVERRIRELSDVDLDALSAEVSNADVQSLAASTTPADAKAMAIRAVQNQTVAEMLPVLLRSKVSRTLGDGPTLATDMVRYLRDVASCRSVDISAELVHMYSDKYIASVSSPTFVSESLPTILADVERTVSALTIDGERQNAFRTRLAFGIRRHLEELVPASMGKFKTFIVTIVAAYYENLHPIVASHILCGVTRSFVKELPTDAGTLASLFYRQTLLNSGPMMLKLLQMVNAVLDTPTKRKYGLLTLRYPVIPRDTMDEIMRGILLQPEFCQRVVDFSASVGHVRKYRWTNHLPSEQRDATFMVKVIKPVTSALTSCWEYELLSKVFERGSDEDANVRAMLVSNGDELDLSQEAKHMREAHGKYTCTYKQVFGIDLEMTLTTIREIPGVLRAGVWQGIAMEVAKGMSLASILEERDIYLNRGQFEAALHRGMDLLVNRWIFTIINDGMYHGDLHAGNIFFSFEDRVMTIIDWGAVGVIDVFGRTAALDLLRHIVIYAIWDNFAAMMDAITAYLRRVGFPLDTSGAEYRALREELSAGQRRNIELSLKQTTSAEDRRADLFGSRRIDSEKGVRCGGGDSTARGATTRGKTTQSIYSYYDVENDTRCETRGAETSVLWEREAQSAAGDDDDHTDLTRALNKLFEFYTTQRINLQSRFPELVTFQKGYALLVGVMGQINYNPYRYAAAVEKAVLNWKHLPRLVNLDIVARMANLFVSEKAQYDQLRRSIEERARLGR